MPSSMTMPASPLACLLEAYQAKAPSLFLLMGPSGSGKTSWCQAAARLAGGRRWSVAGLLSPAVMVDGRKARIDLLDLGSGERRRLATHQEVLAGDETAAGGVITGNWHFDPQTLAWGNSMLAGIGRCDLLIIDELGPLEFRQRQGLQAGLALLDARQHLACVTIRPSLADAAQRRWPWGQLITLTEGHPGGIR